MKRIFALVIIFSISAMVIAAEKAKEVSQTTIAQQSAAKKADLPLEKKIAISSEADMVVVFIPAGEFDMGSPLEELKRDGDETQHHVKISKPFYMGKYEVTQLQYREIMGTNPSKFGSDYQPVENVNWYDVSRFLKKLSDKTGIKFRLPTEAEWEYACRAGTTTAFNTGTTIDSDFANYQATVSYADGIIGQDHKRTVKVGSYPPNAFGLHDMHGNVWEWCSDFYDKNYYKNTPTVDPKGPQVNEGDKVIRGGAWNEKPAKCRSADRNNRGPKTNQPILGFRVVMEIE